MSATIIRCAVYTRKSSEEGLEQAFNSLDAQREAGLDYIKSQKHQGWVAIPTSYDDGGYSGGSIERPGLQRLLADIQSGRVDVVLVYKVDRLSRSLTDFARLMQLFDEHRVSFVSVTQQFNTTTSMGRLTLNMLLSFAQFEREVAGERVRDKIAATFRKGIFVCGQPPLGYGRPQEGDDQPDDRRLRVIPEQAEVVRQIFADYLELGSLKAVAARLNAAGHTTRRWTSGRGRVHGGRQFDAGLIYLILNNPIYLGCVAHTRAGKTQVWPGLHEPIISQATWDRVQAKMARVNREVQTRWTHTHLLKGKLRTFEGYAMSPSSTSRCRTKHERATGQRTCVRYYSSQKGLKQGYASCPIKQLNARFIDDLVRALVLDHLRLRHGIELRAVEPESRDHWVREVIHGVTIALESVIITLVRSRIAQCAAAIKSVNPVPAKRRQADDAGPAADASCRDIVPTSAFAPDIQEGADCITLVLDIRIKRHDGRRILVSPEGQDLFVSRTTSGHAIASPHIVRAIGLAFAWHHELLRSKCTIEEVAKRSDVVPGRVRYLLYLTRLSPAILKAALTGTLSERIQLNDLQAAAEHLDWSLQASALNVVGPAPTEPF